MLIIALLEIPPADYCDCSLCREVREARHKFVAGLVLCNRDEKIIVPTHGEWIGLNLKERDDEPF